MTLTPVSLRLDLKCGKGAISKGEKCTKGAAKQVNQPLNKAGAVVQMAGGLGAAGSLFSGALRGQTGLGVGYGVVGANVVGHAVKAPSTTARIFSSPDFITSLASISQ